MVICKLTNMDFKCMVVFKINKILNNNKSLQIKIISNNISNIKIVQINKRMKYKNKAQIQKRKKLYKSKRTFQNFKFLLEFSKYKYFQK